MMMMITEIINHSIFYLNEIVELNLKFRKALTKVKYGKHLFSQNTCIINVRRCYLKMTKFLFQRYFLFIFSVALVIYSPYSKIINKNILWDYYIHNLFL